MTWSYSTSIKILSGTDLYTCLCLFKINWSDATLFTTFQFPLDVHTLSLISNRVQNVCSIAKGRVSLEEELQTLTWWSLKFRLWPVVLLLPYRMFVSRQQDFIFLIPAETNIVLLVEMTIWSSLHRATIISTSGPCQRAKATTFLSTNRFLSCVDTQRKSTPSDSTPATMCSLLLAKRWSSNCGRPLHSDSQVFILIQLALIGAIRIHFVQHQSSIQLFRKIGFM